MAVARRTLPDLSGLDADALRTLILLQQEELASRDTEIENLKLLIAKLRRMQFGRSSEKLGQQIEQLELRLEDLETSQAERENQIFSNCSRAAEPNGERQGGSPFRHIYHEKTKRISL